ncbi:MAG: putative nucleotidyltransferase substrate binding domain-containing protein, partial [Exilibacterium sp.]
KNSIFLACLTENALKNTPPLGFFRQFVVERNGEHKNAFDMKLRGIMPITDIARIYALAAGVSEINTLKRLKAVANTEWLSLKDARSLCDAYEYISHLRLLHQGRQMQADEVIDNHLSPDAVSGLLKHQLRDAFDVVVRAQAALKLKFTGYFF